MTSFFTARTDADVALTPTAAAVQAMLSARSRGWTVSSTTFVAEGVDKEPIALVRFKATNGERTVTHEESLSFELQRPGDYYSQRLTQFLSKIGAIE
jgi:hypothetical protein